MATALPKPDGAKPATALEIVPAIPADKTLTLADSPLMQKIAAIGTEADALAIASAPDADSAARLLTEVSSIAKQIEATRKTLKDPFLVVCNAIDAAAKKPAQSLSAATNVLRSKLSVWKDECDRRAREEEAKRQAELDRIERARMEVERKAEEAKKAAAASASAAVSNEFSDFDVIAEQDTEALAEAEKQRLAAAAAQINATRAAVVPVRPQGITYRTLLKFEVVDVHSLPTDLVIVTPNDAVIRAKYCTGWREGQPIPAVRGIRFVVEKQPVVASRR